MEEYTLETYYIRYLRKIRKVSDTTVKHYLDGLKFISKFLVSKNKIEQSIFEVHDFKTLSALRAYLYSEGDFLAVDKRGHQMYSAGLNNYCRFAEGEYFLENNSQINELDVPVPIGRRRTAMSGSWERSTILKNQVIEAAGYSCEIDANHLTFTSKSSNHPYMEGHHILPMKFQTSFDSSLDVYANIVCLCPICHRLLHYGISAERQYAIDKLYAERADRLSASGIGISKSDFESILL